MVLREILNIATSICYVCVRNSDEWLDQFYSYEREKVEQYSDCTVTNIYAFNNECVGVDVMMV